MSTTKKKIKTLSLIIIMDKSILVEKIKRWLDTESKINNIQKDLKELRKQKKALSADLSFIMKSKQLECIDVTHGQIIYTQKETKKGINKKYLSDILSKYYKDDGQAKEICAFILENRESSIKENIRLKAHKK
jgi:hypothetical protein